MTTTATPKSPSRLLRPAHESFTDNGRRARYGEAYVRALCAHAGAGFDPTSLDEDVDAVDGHIKFQRMPIAVQIKCTSSYKVGNGRMTLALQQHWIDRWEASETPTFVVVVKVPKAFEDWVEHDPAFTRHRTVAFGKRFLRGVGTKAITFRATDKITSETLYEWRDLAYAIFDGTRS